MYRVAAALCFLSLLGTACTSRVAKAQEAAPSATAAPILHMEILTDTPTPQSAVASPTTVAVVPATSATTTLHAVVTARFLSCRYGPGPEYLYLYALRAGANITLVGRTDGDNWHWVWVEGRNRCWVNTNYLRTDGDWHQLPVVYPGTARLPVSPYYPPTSILSVVRRGSSITVEWRDIPLRLGDEEDPFMQHYLIETWRCHAGQLLFEPFGTNDNFITFVDEPGCTQPSHGRLFVQEKHGFSGPTDIPWKVAN